MDFTFHVLPAQGGALPLEVLAERATASLRRYLASVPIEQLIDLSSGLAQEARQLLAEQTEAARVCLGGIGEPATFWDPSSGPQEVAYGVLPGGGGGQIRRVGQDHGLASSAVQLARTAFEERGGLGPQVEEYLRPGFLFQVERTLGQPPLARLAHGMVAAALAESVGGLVVSVDGAWDAGLWPCRGAELAGSFMRPEAAADELMKRRAEAMLREVPPSFKPFDSRFLARVFEEIVLGLVSEVNAVRGDEEQESIAFDRALGRLDTVSLLAVAIPPRERDLLLGEASVAQARGRPSAFTLLHPTPDEYERWISHLGERLA
ncbi:MAG: hypothetical protein HY901_15650 [Deltaproteobacteria bacterium]|nr:hypothetical protein [Deltaproteobacteria bacterium]